MKKEIIKKNKTVTSKPKEKPDIEKKSVAKKIKTKTELHKYYFSVGRRKSAIAKARLVAEKGEILVNGKKLESYFPGAVNKSYYIEPFRTTNMVSRFSGEIKVLGGGLNSQLGAVILAISRCLLKYDQEKFRPILKKKGFLTRDPRVKERKKPGLMGARKKKQSPKR